MGERTKEDKLLGLLKYMVQDHELYFEKETAKYLIEQLSVEALLNPERITTAKNFVIKSGFLGHVMIKNAYYIDDNELANINEWRELLMEKDPRLGEYPEVFFIPANGKDQTPKFKEHVEIKANFSTFYAIRHLNDWLKMKDKELFGHKLSDINSAVFTLESLCEEQDQVYYPGKDKSTINISNLIMDHVLKGKEEVIKNGWHDEKSFTNKLFSSKRMKVVMKDVEPETIEKLFTTESLGTIIRQANSHDNIKNNPTLLGNLLALAPADKWMEGWSKLYKSKKLNLVDLFNNKFHGAYGVNIINTQKPGLKKENGYGSTKVTEALMDEMEFFLPAIAKMNPEKEQLCYLFFGIMKAKDANLMNLYLDYLDIPHISNNEENAETIKAYQKMIDKLNKEDAIFYSIKSESVMTDKGEKKNVRKANSWKEVYAELKASKLDKALARKDDIPVKRTLKI